MRSFAFAAVTFGFPVGNDRPAVLSRWCPGPDSNRHAFRRPVLSRVCTPVPPPGHSHLPPASYVLRSVRRRLRMAIGTKQTQVSQLVVVAIAIHMIEFQGDRQTHPRNVAARRT